MQFEHACFISYRNGDRSDRGRDARRQDIEDTINAFARDLKNELHRELQRAGVNYDKSIVFLDQDLEEGTTLLSTFASAVCKSVCMVVVFTPHYLNKDKLYCASELEGMFRRLQERCVKLGFDETHKHEWVFTVVLNEPDRVPDILLDNIRFDFTTYSHSSIPLRDHEGLHSKVQTLARKIAYHWECLDQENTLLTEDCENFALRNPDDDQDKILLQEYVSNHVKPIKRKFPFRD